MNRWWRANLWKVVVFPVVAAVLLMFVGLLRGYLHKQAGFDSEGRPLVPPPAVEAPKAPSPRSPVGSARLLVLVAEDLERAGTADRRHLRYLSLLHRHDDPAVDEAQLDRDRQGLLDLVAALSPPNRTAEVVAVDPARCVFRLDLRHLDWTEDTWREVARLYPYGLRLEASKDAEIAGAAQRVRSLTEESLIWVRGDWWVVALVRPPLNTPGSIGLWSKAPPPSVKGVTEGYRNQALNLEVAARELQVLEVGELRKLIEVEATLRDEFGLAPLLRAGGSIPRDAWESNRNLTTPFQELSKLLGRGKPLVVR